MEKQTRQIATLSNSKQSASQGIPDSVLPEKAKRDFIDAFFIKREENSKTFTSRHHTNVDIYSTIIG